MHKYRRKQRALPPLLSTLFVKQLTGVCETEALIGSGGVAVELQPQAIWCAVNDLAQHVVTCVVAKETGRGVLSIINLSVKNTASGEQSMVNRGFSRLEESGLLRTLTRTSKQARGTKTPQDDQNYGKTRISSDSSNHRVRKKGSEDEEKLWHAAVLRKLSE